jgi:putative ABC transport system ATP-binding protein
MEKLPLLELQGVQRSRGEGNNTFRLCVNHFRLEAGQCLAVTGPSGSGKSTFLDLLGLVLRPDKADVFKFRTHDRKLFDVGAGWRNGLDRELSMLRAREVGYVLQTGGLLPFLNARQNIAISQSLLSDRDDAFVDELQSRLDIFSVATKMPHELSIGERQRVAIARAFAHRPHLVLADEPTASLDPKQGKHVLLQMLSLVQISSSALVIVTHDWGMVRSLGIKELEVRPTHDSNHACSWIED